MCYTGAVLVTWGFLLPFDVLRGELIRCHLGLYVAHIEVVLLLRVLIWMLCPYVVPPLEVLHEPLMELSLGYAPSEMVSRVGGGCT